MQKKQGYFKLTSECCVLDLWADVADFFELLSLCEKKEIQMTWSPSATSRIINLSRHIFSVYHLTQYELSEKIHTFPWLYLWWHVVPVQILTTFKHISRNCTTKWWIHTLKNLMLDSEREKQLTNVVLIVDDTVGFIITTLQMAEWREHESSFN